MLSRGYAAARAVELVLHPLMLALSDSERVRGVWVGVFNTDQNSPAILARVREALGLIEVHDPKRYARLRHDVAHILVLPRGGTWGEYRRRFRMVLLNDQFVADSATSTSLLAGIIVHEATHARLRRSGIRHSLRHLARAERVCLSQELAFAQRLPDPAPIREHAESLLSQRDDELMDATKRKVAVEEGLRRRFRLSRWMTRTLMWFFRSAA